MPRSQAPPRGQEGKGSGAVRYDVRPSSVVRAQRPRQRTRRRAESSPRSEAAAPRGARGRWWRRRRGAADSGGVAAMAAPAPESMAVEAALLTEALWRPSHGAGGAAQVLVSSVEALTLPHGQQRPDETRQLRGDSTASTPFPSPAPAALQARFEHTSPPVRLQRPQRTPRGALRLNWLLVHCRRATSAAHSRADALTRLAAQLQHAGPRRPRPRADARAPGPAAAHSGAALAAKRCAAVAALSARAAAACAAAAGARRRRARRRLRQPGRRRRSRRSRNRGAAA